MALSQDEQRVLAEIERRLAAEDPGLASSLATFRRPGPGAILRSPRARIIGSLFTVLIVAMVSLMVYAMIPFRVHGARTPASPSAASQSGATVSSLSATGSTTPQLTTQQAAGTSGSAAGSTAGSTAGSAAGTTSMGAPNSSAAPSSRASSPRAHGNGTAPGQASLATGRSVPSTHGP